MKNEKIWRKIMNKYEEKGLADKASIFSQETISFLGDRKILLDLGAGLGQDSRFFSDQGFIVTCTDVSEKALGIAKEISGGRNIDYLKVDLSKKLPFLDNSFDIVYSHLALHYFNKEETSNLFKEIYRVLKDDGIIVSLFNTIDDPEIKRDNFKRLEDNYYIEDGGIKKRYFCVDCLRDFTKDLFKPLLIDNKGKTYKDEIECLIRFVGKKI